jgi:hypothetical protein
MTVSGLTITSAVRHPVQRCANRTQSHRSVVASRTRRGRRCSTSSWWRRANISSWSAERERTNAPRVRRSEKSTDMIAKKRIHRRPQHQQVQQERTCQ